MLPEPAKPQHVTTIRHDESVRVDVRVECDGRWFRILNWLIDSGTWATLDPASRSVLVVLSRHATTEGVACCSPRDLVAQSGYGRSHVYAALHELVAHGDGLLVRLGPSAWQVLPGRSFRTRSPEPLQRLQSGPPDKSPLQRTGQSSRADFCGQRPGPSPRSESSGIKPDDDETRPEPGVVDELQRLGFGTRDAEHLARATRCSLTDVQTAVRNAEHLEKKGELRSKRGFVRTQLERGPTLFDVVERDDAKKARAQERLETLATQFSRAVSLHATADEIAAIRAVWSTATEMVRAGVVSEHQVRVNGWEALVGMVVEQARGIAAGREVAR